MATMGHIAKDMSKMIGEKEPLCATDMPIVIMQMECHVQFMGFLLFSTQL